jgi:hypothetical protein
MPSTSASGVSRVIVCIVSDAIFACLTFDASQPSVYLNNALKPQLFHR